MNIYNFSLGHYFLFIFSVFCPSDRAAPQTFLLHSESPPAFSILRSFGGIFYREEESSCFHSVFFHFFFVCVSETLGGGQRSSSYIANPPLSSLASRETFQKKINVWGIRCKCCFFFREIFVKTMISRELITTPAPPLTRYAYSS